MKTVLILLALCGSALAYSFSGGYHPVPHFTPHFSSPPHITTVPHFSPAPRITVAPRIVTAPHFSTPETHYFSPFHPQAFWNPWHPYYWIWHHNANPQPGGSSTWGSPDYDQHGVAAWKVVLGIAGAILLVMLIIWGVLKLVTP